ncbi:MAG TPA: lipid-A-disaccharide synthase [Longimicrobiaceae bacterium]|nr:lipid-A-disaccharide synthase [Longimicrobiaceae bacterium]
MADNSRRNGDSAAPTIFLSAGEPSGDIHGAGLIRALRARWPAARFLGLGGPRMAAEGMELLAQASDLAVIGFAEVLHRLPFLLSVRRRVWAALENEQVDLVIPIDYPGFNLRLARRARQRGIPVLYYIAPQVWAWHASRARELARYADAVAVILPFEEKFLRSAGARASFVGHPLLDVPSAAASRDEWAARWSLDASRPILALFPGSRTQELDRHLALFCETATRIVAERPEVQPVIGVAPDLERRLYAKVPWPLVDSASGLLLHADAALVKSGTSTLEAALAATPLVVAYRMHPLSYQLARRLIRVEHIALANLVAGKRIAPEFIQEAATPQALAEVLLPLLDRSSEERRAMVAALEQVRGSLGSQGVADRVAEMAGRLLKN